jgi:sec-independent protein translocase protein TatA
MVRATGSLTEDGPPTVRTAVSSSSLSSDKRNHSDTRNLSMMPFAFLPNLGMPELMIVAFVSLLIFGNRLPSVMRSLGKSVTEFKKGISGIEEEIDQAVTADKKPNPPNV